ncbi:MAG: SPOR domain-containing protein [Ignavibacteria bacterium]|nr:SPOR domain-containing protein [Ignavibacteria bacterium]
MRYKIWSNTVIPALILLFILGSPAYSQDVNIIPYLKQIESGNIDAARSELLDLKEEYPENPSVKFLEGVLTENGQMAVVIYQDIVDNYPTSKYADAALYRIFSYYFALGLYETAQKKLDQLVLDYPGSPYIKIAQQNKFPENGNVSVSNQEDSIDVNEDETVAEQEFKFTIQAGAFSNQNNAESLKEEFLNSGIFSETKEKLVGGTVFHVVYVGKFVTENDAEGFLQVINKKYELSGRIVPITW